MSKKNFFCTDEKKNKANAEEDVEEEVEGATGGKGDEEEEWGDIRKWRGGWGRTEGREEEEKEEENETEQTALQKDDPDYKEKVIIASDTSNACETLRKYS